MAGRNNDATPRRSPANSNGCFFSPSRIGPELINCFSSTSVTPIKHNRQESDKENKDCTNDDESCVIYALNQYLSCSLVVRRNRDEGQKTDGSNLAIAYVLSTTTINVALHPLVSVAAHVAGCKRKRTDD